MSTRYLKYFFEPRSITVVGASPKSNSYGGFVLRNLIDGGFKGRITVLNKSRHEAVHGIPAYRKVTDLPEVPDLAIICVNGHNVPDAVAELAKNNVKAGLVLMGGMARAQGFGRGSLREQALDAARPYGMRLLGPNSLGIIAPGQNLDASYAHVRPEAGKVAFVGQSGMLGTALLDQAVGRGVGFSLFTTLGDSLDVKPADVIDYLAADHATRALLLHIEHLRNPAAFLAAVRAAARIKPVLAFKTGDTSGFEPQVETPGLADRESVWGAVLRRGGVFCVDSVEQLFETLGTLTRLKTMSGNRLAMIANGDGPVRMACDELKRLGGSTARFSEETRAELRKILPPYLDVENPLNINADADPERYAKVVAAISKDKGVDALLAIHSPIPIAPPEAYAEAVIPVQKKGRLLACWMGGAGMRKAWDTLDNADVPRFRTPEQAVRAFMDQYNHERIQTIMQQTPPPLKQGEEPDRQGARAILAEVADADRDFLMPEEAMGLLDAYRIPRAEIHVRKSLEEIADLVKAFDAPVALKALYGEHLRPFRQLEPDAPPRGIVQDIDSPSRLERAAGRLTEQLGAYYPARAPIGWAIQRMRRGRGRLLLSMGITRDPVFGPLIFFGEGGGRNTIRGDRACALPPLNTVLARNLIQMTRVPKILADLSDDPEPHINALADIVSRLSQLAADQPHLATLEINPFLLRGGTLLALDVTATIGKPIPSLIRPYPDHLSQDLRLKDGRHVTLRPVRGEDEPAHARFAERLSRESVRLRFFSPIARFSHKQLAQLTQIDYDREMAFIAAAIEDGQTETLGVVRTMTDPDNFACELAVIIRDDLSGQGLGSALMRKILDYNRQLGTILATGTVLPENAPMLALAKALGFSRRFRVGEGVVEINLQLNEPKDAWQRRRLETMLE